MSDLLKKCLVLILFLPILCSCADMLNAIPLTPNIKAVNKETEKKIPLSVGIYASESMKKNYATSSCTSSYYVWINSGSAYLSALEDYLSKKFEKVEFFSDKENTNVDFDIKFIPNIRCGLTLTKGSRIRTKSEQPWYNFDISNNINLSLTAVNNGYAIANYSATNFSNENFREGMGTGIEGKYTNPYGINKDSKKVVEKNLNLSFSSLVNKIDKSQPLINLIAKKIERNSLPSNFEINVLFSDKNSFNPNLKIDAGETSEIVVSIVNKGKGTAFDVKIQLMTKIKHIEIPAEMYVGDLQPNESKEVTIPIVADLELKSGTTNLLFVAREKRGFDSRTIQLNVATAKLQRPDLKIVNYRINDGNTGLARGNGNGIPENGESVEIISYVKNVGVGRAVQVKTAINGFDPAIIPIRGQSVIEEIAPGQTVESVHAFTIPRMYSGKKIGVRVNASDVRGVSDATRDLTLKMISNMPVLAYDYRIIDADGNGTLESGEEAELEITLKNNGRIDAQKIQISLSSDQLVFSKTQDRIARLSAETKYTPLRFSFRVPRILDAPKSSVQIKIAQQDFQGYTDNIHVPIRSVSPDFAITHQLIDSNNNGVIEQGEAVDLIVQVRNTGELDAGNVKLKIGFDKDGVVYAGSKTVDIGFLAAGQSSDGKTFSFNITRRATSGTLPIIFKVTQDEFPTKEIPLALDIVADKAEVITIAGQKKNEYKQPVMNSVNSNFPPIVFIAMPQNRETVASPFETISGVVGDDKGVANIEVYLNGKRVDAGKISITTAGNDQRKRPFNIRLPLEVGKNVIEVIAFDVDNLSGAETLTVFREAEKGEIYAAVIGINNYRYVDHLSYASNDALAFSKYMRENMGLDSNHLFELYDEKATMRNIKSLLGTKLRKKADRPEDTVFIYFAGHGAPEEDSQSLDGDGISKYILAHDSDMNDLYTSAIPMDEIARIFSRIRAERIVFLSDSCFSGGSGGRTVLAPMKRSAIISDKFLDRIANAGKGRVILTSSSAQELSQESDQLGHGYFTYYLLEGLRGAADIGNDGEVDVDEIYQYLNVRVAEATNGKQHPMKRGETEGRVILGRVSN